MAILSRGASVRVEATPESYLMLAGGKAMDSPRKINWNFVASDSQLIDTARDDWRTSIENGFSGSPFQLPMGESEFIPLPDD